MIAVKRRNGLVKVLGMVGVLSPCEAIRRGSQLAQLACRVLELSSWEAWRAGRERPALVDPADVGLRLPKLPADEALELAKALVTNGINIELEAAREGVAFEVVDDCWNGEGMNIPDLLHHAGGGPVG